MRQLIGALLAVCTVALAALFFVPASVRAQDDTEWWDEETADYYEDQGDYGDLAADDEYMPWADEDEEYAYEDQLPEDEYAYEEEAYEDEELAYLPEEEYAYEEEILDAEELQEWDGFADDGSVRLAEDDLELAEYPDGYGEFDGGWGEEYGLSEAIAPELAPYDAPPPRPAPERADDPEAAPPEAAPPLTPEGARSALDSATGDGEAGDAEPAPRLRKKNPSTAEKDFTLKPLPRPGDPGYDPDRLQREPGGGDAPRGGPDVLAADPRDAKTAQDQIKTATKLPGLIKNPTKEAIKAVVPKVVDSEGLVLDVHDKTTVPIAGKLDPAFTPPPPYAGEAKYMGSRSRPNWPWPRPDVTIGIDGKERSVGIPPDIERGKYIEFYRVPDPNGGYEVQARSGGDTWQLKYVWDRGLPSWTGSYVWEKKPR